MFLSAFAFNTGSFFSASQETLSKSFLRTSVFFSCLVVLTFFSFISSNANVLFLSQFLAFLYWSFVEKTSVKQSLKRISVFKFSDILFTFSQMDPP